MALVDEAELQAKTQEIWNAVWANTSRAQAAQDDADSAQGQADRNATRIYSGDLEQQVYTNEQIQLLRSELMGSGGIGGLRDYVDTDLKEAIKSETDVQVAAITAQVDSALAQAGVMMDNLQAETDAVFSAASEIMDTEIPIINAQFQAVDTKVVAAQSSLDAMLEGYTYASLKQGLDAYKQQFEETMVAIGRSRLTLPASFWTNSSTDTEPGTKAPVDPSWFLYGAAKDPILGDCIELPVASDPVVGITIGQSEPFEFDADRVLRIQVKLRVMHDGTGTLDLRFGASSWQNETLLHPNEECPNVAPLPLASDGEVTLSCYVSMNAVRMNQRGLSTISQGPDRAILVPSSGANLVYLHLRQVGSGQVRIATIEVTDVTHALEAADYVREELNASIGSLSAHIEQEYYTGAVTEGRISQAVAASEETLRTEFESVMGSATAAEISATQAAESYADTVQVYSQARQSEYVAAAAQRATSAKSIVHFPHGQNGFAIWDPLLKKGWNDGGQAAELSTQLPTHADADHRSIVIQDGTSEGPRTIGNAMNRVFKAHFWIRTLDAASPVTLELTGQRLTQSDPSVVVNLAQELLLGSTQVAPGQDWIEVDTTFRITEGTKSFFPSFSMGADPDRAQVYGLELVDITESWNAEDGARASAGSASAAKASEDASGAHAEAARLHGVSAQTASQASLDYAAIAEAHSTAAGEEASVATAERQAVQLARDETNNALSATILERQAAEAAATDAGTKLSAVEQKRLEVVDLHGEATVARDQAAVSASNAAGSVVAARDVLSTTATIMNLGNGLTTNGYLKDDFPTVIDATLTHGVSPYYAEARYADVTPTVNPAYIYGGRTGYAGWVGPLRPSTMMVEIEIESRNTNDPVLDIDLAATWRYNGTNYIKYIPLTDAEGPSKLSLNERGTFTAIFEDPYPTIAGHEETRFFIRIRDTGVRFRIHRFNARPGTKSEKDQILLEASTQILQQSVADLEGNAAATLSLKARAGGASAGIDIVASDNPNSKVSKVRFTADNIELDGDVVVNGTLTPTQIQAGTLTKAAHGWASSKSANGTSWTTVLTTIIQAGWTGKIAGWIWYSMNMDPALLTGQEEVQFTISGSVIAEYPIGSWNCQGESTMPILKADIGDGARGVSLNARGGLYFRYVRMVVIHMER